MPISSTQPRSTGSTYAVVSPATGEALGELPRGTPDDIDRAVDCASRGVRALGSQSHRERSAICKRVATLLLERSAPLARLLSAEQGKPLYSEAEAEIKRAALFWETAAEVGFYNSGTYHTSLDPNKRIFETRYPLGVYGIITPWNFPMAIPSEYLSFGTIAGNGMVWVPAPTTSLIALELAGIMIEAGVPSDAINVVTGEGAVVGDALARHSGVQGIGLTGSPATGESVARVAAGKSLVLELGGNGPTIVLEDADLERAARAIAGCAFLNAGQICSATGWVIANGAIKDELVERVVAEARGVVVGLPSEPETTMGPLHRRESVQKYDAHLSDATRRGASIAFGGEHIDGLPTTRYVAPAVVTDVTPEMLVAQEETFGPVVPISEAASDRQAEELARASSYGLVASVFTRDIERAFWFVERLEFGEVLINEGSRYWEPHVPFGGWAGKRSGSGRIGGTRMLDAMSNTKTIVIDVS